jgi:hypothetical protein
VAGRPGWSANASGGKKPNTVSIEKTGTPSARHSTSNETMIIVPTTEMSRSVARVRTTFVSGVTSPVIVAVPSRLRKSRSLSISTAQPA